MTPISGITSNWKILIAKLSATREGTTRPKTGHRGIDEMLECIHEHVFEHDFNVGRLRELCRIRDNNQSSRFRLLVGEPPRAYIERLRLEAAFQLLQEHPETNALDIGFLVGYEHPQTFYRAFQRRFDSPPGEVRE